MKKITTSAAGGIYYHVHQGFVDTIIVPAAPSIFTITSSAYRRPSPEGYQILGGIVMHLLKLLQFLCGAVTIMSGLSVVPAHAQAPTCMRSVIQQPAPFMGNHGEVFVLANGTIWRVQGSYEYLYEYYPTVILCPQQGFVALRDKQIGVAYVGKVAQ